MSGYRCDPGCRCGKHVYHGGAKKCETGCRCKRHSVSGRPRTSWQERFWSKVDKTGDCWIWTPARHRKDSERLAMFSANCEGKKNVSPWRWIYAHEVGPIPEGLEIDHTCENWRCVRPSHLEAVTRKVNNERYAGTRRSWTLRDSMGRFAGRRDA